MLDLEAVKQHEEALRLQVRSLSDEQRKRFYHAFQAQMKDPDTYAVFNYLFVAGLHHFYLGRMARGWLNLAVFGVGSLLLFSKLVWVGLGVIAVISLVELAALFQAEAIVTDYNNRLMEQILKELFNRSVAGEV